MLIRIPFSKLKIGVFIEEEKLKDYSDVFPSHAFTLKDETQISKLKALGFTEIHINVSKGRDITLGSTGTSFIGFPIDVLLINETLPFNLLLKKKNNEYVSYLSRGQVFNDEVYYFLRNEYHYEQVYVSADEKENLRKYAERYKKQRSLSEEGLAQGFATKERVKKYNEYISNYIPVNKTVFTPGLECPVDIYREKDLEMVKLVSAGSKIPESDIFATFVKGDKNSNNIQINKDDAEKYRAFLREVLDSSKGSSEQKKKLKLTVMKENSRFVTKELMENPRSGEALQETKALVADMVENIMENPSSFYGLMKLETYDYYTYLHSVNVCTLSVGLGMVLGLTKKELQELATGALIHDIGKSIVPAELINKPGKLTEEEFNVVKTHVNLGYQAMKDRIDIPKGAFYSMLQHHEKLDGSGYPRSLKGDQVHLYGRILAIVDIYDALTTERSYKKAFRPFDAVKILRKTPEAFDQNVFKEFVLMLGKQMLHD